MTFPEHERQVAEESLNAAYEHLADFIDTAMDAHDEQAQIDGQEAQDAIQRLINKYAKD